MFIVDSVVFYFACAGLFFLIVSEIWIVTRDFLNSLFGEDL